MHECLQGVAICKHVSILARSSRRCMVQIPHRECVHTVSSVARHDRTRATTRRTRPGCHRCCRARLLPGLTSRHHTWRHTRRQCGACRLVGTVHRQLGEVEHTVGARCDDVDVATRRPVAVHVVSVGAVIGGANTDVSTGDALGGCCLQRCTHGCTVGIQRYILWYVAVVILSRSVTSAFTI